MATPLSAAKVLSALKAEGITVQEYKSWKTNNRNHKGASGPRYGVVIHHTVSKEDDASVELCYGGHSALPGPLCHAVGRNDGRIALVGHGRANHAGNGDPDVLAAVKAETALPADNQATVDGNAPFYGLEIVNLGDGKDTYPLKQYVSAVKWAAAHCRAHGWNERSVIMHSEWQPGKIDPRGPVEAVGPFTGDTFRKHVKACLALPAGKWTLSAATPVEPPKQPPVVEKPSAPAVGAPKPITESSTVKQELGNDWSLVNVATDESAVTGPAVYYATVYAVVQGAPGARVKARFEDYDTALRRPSYDLPVDAGVIGPDGLLNVFVGRPGALTAGEVLRFSLRAPGARVIRVILRGLRWNS